MNEGNLILSRMRDESLMIGNHIEVSIVDIRGDKVRLGTRAPKTMPIWRREIWLAIQACLPPDAKTERGCTPGNLELLARRAKAYADVYAEFGASDAAGITRGLEDLLEAADLYDERNSLAASTAADIEWWSIQAPNFPRCEARDGEWFVSVAPHNKTQGVGQSFLSALSACRLKADAFIRG